MKLIKSNIYRKTDYEITILVEVTLRIFTFVIFYSSDFTDFRSHIIFSSLQNFQESLINDKSNIILQEVSTTS